VAQDPRTVWKPIKIAKCYGSGERTIEIASAKAVWYSTGLFAVPVRWVLIRDPRAEFKTQALLCGDLGAAPQKILSWFVMRWHLGFETQRQCSELAIRRTTPALLGFWFSLVTVFAHRRMVQPAGAFRQAAW